MNNILIKYKKLTSLLLIFTVVFSFSYSTVTFAANPYEFKLVADFSDGTLDCVLDSTEGNVELDTEVTFGTGKSTVKWSLDSEPFVAPLIHNFRDEIKQDFINAGGDRTKALVTLRFYSDAKGAVVTLNPCTESGMDTPSSDERVTTYSFTVGSTGWQEASVPFQSYMYSNIVTDGLKFIAESGSGDIWFDSVWFERVPYSTVPTTELVSASVENNATFVPAELDGSNTISYEFKENIGNFDAEKAVEVYEINGSEEVLTSQNYSLSAEGKNLNITFDSPLTSPMSYRIILNEGMVEDERGRALDEESNILFSVGKGAPFFTAEPALENEAEVEAQDGFEYNITLSSEFSDESFADYVTVYKDGKKLREGISVEKDGTTLRILFDTLAPGSTYHIALDETFADAYGTILSGESVFSFKTAKGAVAAEDMHLYSSADNIAPNRAGSGDTSAMVSENTHFYEQTAKLGYAAGQNARFDLIKSGTRTDISSMNYMNCWIYNPEPSDETLMYFIGIPKTEGGQTTYYTFHDLDWSGWKLVSSPFTDFGNMMNDVNQGTAVQIRIAFNMGNTNTKSDGYILLDDAWLSENEVKVPEIVNSSISDGTSDVSIFNTFIDYEMNTQLENIPDISVTDDSGNKFEDFTAELDSGNLKISFGTLAPLTGYTVSVSGAKSASPALLDMIPYEMSFTTSGEGIEVKSIDFNQNMLKTSQDVKALYNISNTTGNSINTKLHLAAYDDDGNLVAVNTAAKSPSADAQYELTLTSDKIQNASYVKAFVTIGDMMLVSDYFALFSGIGKTDVYAYNTAPIEGVNAVSFDSVELKSEELTANVLLSGVKDVALVSISDYNGNLIIYEPVSAGGSELEYSYSFADDIKSSLYTLKVTSGGKAAEYEILYVSSADRESCVELANGEDEEALYEFLDKNSEVFALEDASFEYVEDAAMVLIENKPYDDYDSVIETIDNFNKVFEGLGNLLWSELADYIIENNKVLLGDNKYYDEFTELSKSDRNAYAKELFKKLPVSTISDFRDEFTAILKDGLSSASSGSSGGGGGSGSSKSTTVAVIPPVVDVHDDAIANTVVFDDLDSFVWAEESILLLHSKGVVSSDANKKFRPADSITREEFVKLLVSYMYGNVSEAGHTFTDSIPGAWYEPYLSKAFEVGIVTGRPDGSFGIGENITREDMAVIVYRALTLSGKSVSNENASAFADESLISDYALDAVNSLSSSSIINGIGSNLFAPKDNANRAQAAVIIARLYNIN